jgi:transposase InsO family protein
VRAAAEAAGVSVRCARKWANRYRLQGERGLLDRSSAPRRVANRTPADRIAAIVALRQLRMTGAEIADTLAMPLSTVSALLTRLGMGRLARIGLERPQRYERSRPGELVHIDVKRLGRIEGGAGWRVRGRKQHYNPTFTDKAGNKRRTVGWEYVHIAVDDHSRLAYAEVLPDKRTTTAVDFLRRALAFFARYGITVERLLTDNGPAYRSTIHALAWRSRSTTCAAAPTGRRRTARRNASSGRCLTAGAYGAIYRSSAERTAALDGWLWHYNHRRRHSALGRQPPVSRTNLLGSYS